MGHPKLMVGVLVLLTAGASLFLARVFFDGQWRVQTSCGAILNTAEEFAGVAKSYALKKHPSTTSIAIISSKDFIDDESGPYRYLFRLLLYQKAKMSWDGDVTTYTQDTKTVAVTVSVCADLWSYEEISA